MHNSEDLGNLVDYMRREQRILYGNHVSSDAVFFFFFEVIEVQRTQQRKKIDGGKCESEGNTSHA